MKKIRIFLLLLAGILVLGLTPGTGKAAETSPYSIEALIMDSASEEEVGNAQPTAITIGNQGDRSTITPVHVKEEGVLYYYVSLPEDKIGTVITFILYEDAACTRRVSDISVYSGEQDGDRRIKGKAAISKRGTYYLKCQVLTTDAMTEDPITVSGIAALFSEADAVLKNGKMRVGGSGNGSPVYYKLTMKEPGIAAAALKELPMWDKKMVSNLHLTLCDQNKKPVSSQYDMVLYDELDQDYLIFSMKAGTYYFKVETEPNSVFCINAVIKNVKEKSGNSKKNAAALGKKWVTGLLAASEGVRDADWYKLTIETTRKVNVGFFGSITPGGSITAEFFNSKGESFGRKVITGIEEEQSFSPYVGKEWDSNHTLPKGTYYIKVSKDRKISSGYYELFYQ